MILSIILTIFVISLLIYISYSFVVANVNPIEGTKNVLEHTVEAWRGT